jgi:hypothetical protein
MVLLSKQDNRLRLQLRSFRSEIRTGLDLETLMFCVGADAPLTFRDAMHTVCLLVFWLVLFIGIPWWGVSLWLSVPTCGTWWCVQVVRGYGHLCIGGEQHC